MKKIILLLALLVVLSLPTLSMADTLLNSDGEALSASDWVQTGHIPGSFSWELIAVYTDTDGNGTTGIAIPIRSSGDTGDMFKSAWVEYCTTDPGATAPTDNYDIEIQRAVNGADLFQGGLYNRDTSSTETGWPAVGFMHPTSALQLVVTNQSQAGAIVTLYISVTQ